MPMLVALQRGEAVVAARMACKSVPTRTACLAAAWMCLIALAALAFVAPGAVRALLVVTAH